MHRHLRERAHVYLFLLYLVQVILYDIFLLFRSYFVFNLPQIGVKFYRMIRLCGKAEAAGFGRRAVACACGILKEGEEWHFAL